MNALINEVYEAQNRNEIGPQSLQKSIAKTLPAVLEAFEDLQENSNFNSRPDFAYGSKMHAYTY